MKRQDIATRADVSLLVRTFYISIQKDTFIGPIFLKIIPTDAWESHLEKLTDFWETNLLAARNFKGNPMRAHKDVDAKWGHQISQNHFDAWLALWSATVDALFEGVKATEAKDRARTIATVLFFKMQETRPVQ